MLKLMIEILAYQNMIKAWFKRRISVEFNSSHLMQPKCDENSTDRINQFRRRI